MPSITNIQQPRNENNNQDADPSPLISSAARDQRANVEVNVPAPTPVKDIAIGFSLLTLAVALEYLTYLAGAEVVNNGPCHKTEYGFTSCSAFTAWGWVSIAGLSGLFSAIAGGSYSYSGLRELGLFPQNRTPVEQGHLQANNGDIERANSANPASPANR